VNILDHWVAKLDISIWSLKKNVEYQRIITHMHVICNHIITCEVSIRDMYNRYELLYDLSDCMTDIGTSNYHRQLSRTQFRQARSCTVLNGKSTHCHYPDVAFWSWNDRSTLNPTRVNLKTGSSVYQVGFPSVFQTSEALRFDLVHRPASIRRSRKVRLGIGHTVHVGKHVYNTVWSLYYHWTHQCFTPTIGIGKQVLTYLMTIFSTVFTTRKAPRKWTVELQLPNYWENDVNVQAVYHIYIIYYIDINQI
jgi:hypothetical protein